MKFLIRSTIIPTIFSLFILLGCTRSNPSEKLNPLLEKYLVYWNTGEFNRIEET